jgi:hypothetical protein
MDLLWDAGMIGMQRLQVLKVCKNEKWVFKILKACYSVKPAFASIKRDRFL